MFRIGYDQLSKLIKTNYFYLVLNYYFVALKKKLFQGDNKYMVCDLNANQIVIYSGADPRFSLRGAG